MDLNRLLDEIKIQWHSGKSDWNQYTKNPYTDKTDNAYIAAVIKTNGLESRLKAMDEVKG